MSSFYSSRISAAATDSAATPPPVPRPPQSAMGMKKEDDGAVPLSLPPPAITAATVARPCRPPHMMRVFSRFSPKKVPLEDTTDSVVVEPEAAARLATGAGGSGRAAGYEGVHGGHTSLIQAREFFCKITLIFHTVSILAV